MVDEPNDSWFLIAKEVRQRLENLRRAGLEDLPIEIVVRAAEPRVRRSVNPPREAEESYREARPAVLATPPPRVMAVPPTIPRSPASSLFDSEAMTEPAVPADERHARLDALAAEVAGCTRCPALPSRSSAKRR